MENYVLQTLLKFCSLIHVAVEETSKSSAIFVNDECELVAVRLVITLSALVLNAIAIAALHINIIQSA